MNKKEIEQLKSKAIEKAKENLDIYYNGDIRVFTKGFDAAVKLFSMHDIIKSETTVCRCFTHYCPTRNTDNNTCLVNDFDCEDRQSD
ncbi:MAG: hypothetical protein HN704_18305 [Bacteroidetes bacterium]|jgi:hypothetical protein|nr:hypothetical protein [Bacteroidota bacterium]MBT7493556.1 hypothetical protein [Bacteroidota bacterium]